MIIYKMYNEDNSELFVNMHIHKGEYPLLHNHTYWEIMIMLDKSCINSINGKESILSQNDIQLLRPDDFHIIKKYDNQIHTNINIEIKPIFFKKIFDDIDESLIQKIIDAKEIKSFRCFDEELKRYKELIHRAQLIPFPANIERQIILKQLAMSLIINIMYHINQVIGSVDNNNNIIDKIILLMKKEENIALGFSDICKIQNYSKEYIIRIFKKNKMETPNIIFRNIKLDYACGLLDTTDFTTVLIAEKIGFGSVGYFNKIFVERYGMSPGAYRKIHRH